MDVKLNERNQQMDLANDIIRRNSQKAKKDFYRYNINILFVYSYCF